MTWTVSVINNSSNTVISRANSVSYVEGQAAIIAVVGVGSICMLDVGHQNGGPHYWAVRVTSGTDYNQLWWYDGNGACTLTINADNSFTLTGQGQTLTGQIGAPLLPVMNLPAGLPIYASAFVNAGYQQRLIITVAGGTNILQWSGTGEGNVSIADNAKFTVPGASGTTVQAVISIDFLPNGGGNWGHSAISTPSQCAVRRYNQTIFVSEDSIDYDWNDMTALISWWSLS
jgi:hypothetical protein